MAITYKEALDLTWSKECLTTSIQEVVDEKKALEGQIFSQFFSILTISLCLPIQIQWLLIH